MTDIAAGALQRQADDQRIREWVGSCLRKRRFTSVQRVEAAIERARVHRGVRLYHYLCRHCGGYHLTRIEP